MAVSKTSYSNGMFVTLEGTLAEVMAQLVTDEVGIERCRFVYDAGNSKVICIYA